MLQSLISFGFFLKIFGRHFWGSLWCWRYLCGTSGPEVGGRKLSTAGRSFENKLHSIIRWRAVCIAFLGQLQTGEGFLFILWRYEQKLPWFVRNWVRRKLGQSERGSLWKMVGMNSLVWEAFAELTYVYRVPDFCVVVFQWLFSLNGWDYVLSDGGIVARNCFGQAVCPLVSFQSCVSFDPVEGDRGGVS